MPQTREFEFKPGPVFANLVLGDEINRAPAKTQAALLEAMVERQVTVDGGTYRLEAPFMVIATQNSLEMEGTCRAWAALDGRDYVIPEDIQALAERCSRTGCCSPPTPHRYWPT